MKVEIKTLVDVDALVGMVREQFYDVESYEKACKNPKGHDVDWLCRTQEVRGYTLADMCKTLGIDQDKLCSIARAARKWEQIRNWERCFPVDENAEQIWNYIKAAE